MRIAVLETNQKPEESPSRHVSKKRAAKFIARKIARWLIPDKLLQMTKDDDTIRGDWEHFRAQIDVIPVKRKQWNQNLLISYPLADQRSNPAYWAMKLSRTERDMLRFFEENAGKTLTRTEIVKGVWDYEYLGLTNVVDVNVCSLRSKGVNIQTIRGIGYRMPQPVVPESPKTRSETFTHHNI